MDVDRAATSVLAIIAASLMSVRRDCRGQRKVGEENGQLLLWLTLPNIGKYANLLIAGCRGTVILLGGGFMNFAEKISSARKAAGLSQRELTARITKEDGTRISPQYLNDLEHGQRNPPGPHMLKQFAYVLGIPYDVLFFAAGQYPDDVRDKQYSQDQLQEAFQAFRRKLQGE